MRFSLFPCVLISVWFCLASALPSFMSILNHKTPVDDHSTAVADHIYGYHYDGTPITKESLRHSNVLKKTIDPDRSLAHKQAQRSAIVLEGPPKDDKQALNADVSQQINALVNGNNTLGKALADAVVKQINVEHGKGPDCKGKKDCGLRISGVISIQLGGKQANRTTPFPASGTKTDTPCAFETTLPAGENTGKPTDVVATTRTALATTEKSQKTGEDTESANGCIALDWNTFSCVECPFTPKENASKTLKKRAGEPELWCVNKDGEASICFPSTFDCQYYYGFVSSSDAPRERFFG